MSGCIEYDDDSEPLPGIFTMDLQTLLITFAQISGLKYEDVLQKANQVIDGGFNSFKGHGIEVKGGNADERRESLRKELESKFVV